MALDRRLEILAVCGVGMGSSLMLKMTAEDALRSLGPDAHVGTPSGLARALSGGLAGRLRAASGGDDDMIRILKEALPDA
ncbi:MAG: hypothetical protein FWJ90_15135 [Actinomadura sp.]